MLIKNEAEIVILMKMLSNKSRLKILYIIYNAEKDLCVNEISRLAQISQSLTSHQLAYLSANGVVEGHRMGQTMCYLPAKNELSNALSKLLKLFSTER